MEHEFNVIIERDEEGWFVARVPEIRGCHTQAKSLDKLMARTREAIEACLEAGAVPKQVSRFVGVQRISIAS
ncbi:MAG TPA: type II toxin-antitoxin system HicB family antitoxin [Phycisphaerae bacterium]|nr:type II toxin-antitoxin system HicB family antitoxin [Phycisphaerae bacterium]HNU45967.1 type II toxin-antitoxin system HicB family antitoxin [Phycisphaerae bacterium]